MTTGTRNAFVRTKESSHANSLQWLYLFHIFVRINGDHHTRVGELVQIGIGIGDVEWHPWRKSTSPTLNLYLQQKEFALCHHDNRAGAVNVQTSLAMANLIIPRRKQQVVHGHKWSEKGFLEVVLCIKYSARCRWWQVQVDLVALPSEASKMQRRATE